MYNLYINILQTVKIWDDLSGKCLKTLLQDNSITSVSIDGTNKAFFLACACNQKIMLWKISKNKLNNYSEVKIQEFYEHFKRLKIEEFLSFNFYKLNI